jgi:AraC family transcriptional regulator
MTRTLSEPVATEPVVRQWDLPGLRVKEAFYPPLYRMALHADGRTRVSLLLAGAVEEFADGVPQFAGPGSAVLKPGDVVHANRFGPAGAHVVTVEPDAARLEALAGAPAGFRYRWCHDVPATLSDSIARVLHAPTARRAAAVWDSLAGFLALGAGRVAVCRPPRWLDAGRRALHVQAEAPPGVQGLAAEAGVHPVYFARAFRRYFRCTIREYVRRLRVLNAAELLATSNRPLAHVALAVGFTDQAHFGHAFRRETGSTPHAYRLAHHRREVAFLQSPTPASAYHADRPARDEHPGSGADGPRRRPEGRPSGPREDHPCRNT